MLTPASPSVTKISFRRDVRTFLSVLVGFLAVLIFVLLVLLQQFSHATQSAVTRQWNAIADAAASQISDARDPSDLRLREGVLMSKYGIDSIEIGGAEPERLGSAPGASHVTLTRTSSKGPVRFTFDDTDLRSVVSRFKTTASISVAAALTGLILLTMYMPRITRPIEEMLDHAREVGTPTGQQDETTFLIETFRESISRLKAQEVELKRLHESEKTRADELEIVTATLTRSLASGFVALDPTGTVRQANAAAREILAIPPDRDIHVDIGTLIGESPLADVLESAVCEAATLTRIEVDHPVGAASVSIGLTAVPLIGEGSRFIGMLALFTDLTPIKRLESRVRAMQTLAELGEIAAGIAHEFRNSLSTILGYLKLLQRSDLPAEATSRLRMAEQEANDLSEAVQRLLTFTRPMDLHRETVDLRGLVDAIIDRLRATSGQIAFVVTGYATIEGDRALLSRALENVLRNAVDAVAGRGSEARIVVTLAGRPPAITVADNGVGLDESDAARLLLPFVSNKPGGFGLGLSLARKIVVLHGGDIKLNGTPGRGAVVTLQFAEENGQSTAESVSEE